MIATLSDDNKTEVDQGNSAGRSRPWVAVSGSLFPSSIVALIIGLLLTAWAVYAAASMQDAERQMLLAERTQELASELRANIATTQTTMEGLRGLFKASEKVDRREFEDYVSSISTRDIVRAMAWAPVVAANERAAYEAKAEADGLAGFVFTQSGGTGKANMPRESAPIYFPVFYISPIEENRRALGFDLRSNAARRAAIETAIRTKSVTATSRISLVQGTGPSYGALLILPVAARKGEFALDGVHSIVNGVIDISSLLHVTLQRTTGVDDCALFDMSSAPGERRLVPHDGSETLPEGPYSEVNFGGRAWRVYLGERSIAAIQPAGTSPAAVLLTGLLISALGAGLFEFHRQRSRRLLLAAANSLLEDSVRARTIELEAARANAVRDREQIEVLLIDVNHRVGNNLAMVSSFLAMQERAMRSPEAAAALAAARSRVYAIAATQRRTGVGCDFTRSRTDTILREVLDSAKSLLTEATTIEDEIAALSVPQRDGVLIGLVVNELITNALRHAFPDGGDGIIEVQLLPLEGSGLTITVRDNGVGQQADRDDKAGIGTQIVRLVSHQLGDGAPTIEAARSNPHRPGQRTTLRLTKVDVRPIEGPDDDGT